MIKHDLKVGEEIWIGDTRITLKRKSGQVCSLIIDAPEAVKIKTPKSIRREQEENAGKETA